MRVRRSVTDGTFVLLSLYLSACGEAAPLSTTQETALPPAPAADAASVGPAASHAAASAPQASGACVPGPSASSPFTGALCTCRDANIQGYLRTRTMSSGSGPSSGAASVGIDHDYVIASAGANAGFTDVGGSFQIAGDATALDGFLAVDGDLRSQGTLDVKGYTHVTGDAWLGGDFRNTGFAQIAGDLHIQGHDVLPAWVAGKRFPGPVTVAPPCACDPSQLLDVASLVAAAKGQNDDVAISLSPGAWSGVIGDVNVTLPAGRYYLDAIRGIGNLVIHVTGPVALFVGGNLDPIGRFAITLDPAAQLDLYVGGDIHFVGYEPLGDATRPAATRIYAATHEDIDLTGFPQFIGNLYAPWARVTSKGFVDVAGSLFVRDFAVAGFASFVYDAAVTGPGGGVCSPPPCQDGVVCPPGLACRDGECVP